MRSRAKERELFEESPVLKAIINLAFPSVMGQIILVIYNMADTFFVGLTGSYTMITSVTVCMPAFMFLSAISNLFGVGGASVISRSLGQHNDERARRTSAFAIWGCAAVTLMYSMGALILRDPFIDVLGGSAPEVHNYACQYLMVTVVIGGIATATNTLLSHLVRAEGRSMQASIGIALGGILNIALDPLFMFVILPPGNEALGAAIATTVSNFCALIYYIVIITLNRKKLVLSVRPGKDMFDYDIPKDVVTAGTPACLMTLCENISYAVLDNRMFGAGEAVAVGVGVVAQAGVGVAKKVNMLAHCIVRGMTQGVLPLIGYNYASGNYKRMKSTVYISASISVGISVLCMTVCLLFSPALISFFIQNEDVLAVGGTVYKASEFGASFLRIMCIGAPFSAVAYTVISFFQATGHGIKSLILALLRKGVLDIPMMFIIDMLIPIYGIVMATPIADVLCCTAAITLFARFLKHVSLKAAEETDATPEIVEQEQALA